MLVENIEDLFYRLKAGKCLLLIRSSTDGSIAFSNHDFIHIDVPQDCLMYIAPVSSAFLELHLDSKVRPLHDFTLLGSLARYISQRHEHLDITVIPHFTQSMGYPCSALKVALVPEHTQPPSG